MLTEAQRSYILCLRAYNWYKEELGLNVMKHGSSACFLNLHAIVPPTKGTDSQRPAKKMKNLSKIHRNHGIS